MSLKQPTDNLCYVHRSCNARALLQNLKIQYKNLKWGRLLCARKCWKTASSIFSSVCYPANWLFLTGYVHSTILNGCLVTFIECPFVRLQRLFGKGQGMHSWSYHSTCTSFLKPWWYTALKLVKKHHWHCSPFRNCHLAMKNNILWVCFKLSASSSASDKLCSEQSWGDMAFRSWKRLLLLGRQDTFAKAWRSRRGGGPSLCWKCCSHWSTGKSLDPEVRAFLEENTEVTSSGHLTPEIRLRLLTPRCRFWKEKPDLWPYGDPFWAIYWPGGQALSR